MAAKYKDEAERWKRQLEDCEAYNARLRDELVAVHQAVQQVYSTGAVAKVLTSMSTSCVHPIASHNPVEVIKIFGLI